MANTQTTQSLQESIHQEHILVVKRAHLFQKEGAWNGLRGGDVQQYLDIIHSGKEFLPRAVMETDPTYKQIIPYLVFRHQDRYFLMQRAAKSTETRLKNKYSLGIGGHIRQEDIQSDSIVDWAYREFHEEVHYQSMFTVKPLGVLNDDSNPVGQVHIGFVFLVEGETDEISIKSELQSGELLSLKEMHPYFPDMESWSQIVYEYLKGM